MFFGAFQKQFLNRRSTSIVCVAIVLLLSLIAEAERLPIKTYTVADGLPQNSINRIMQDASGFF